MIQKQEWLELLSLALGPAMIGLAMGVFRHAREGGAKGWKQVCLGCGTSAMVAVMTGFFLDMWDLPPTVTFAAIGMSGYAGGRLLDAALERMEREIRTARLPGIKSGKWHEDE